MAPTDSFGLVDWESASVGPRSMEIVDCRDNVLYEGLDAAEVFMRGWERHSDRTFHRWADIATIIGLFDAKRRQPPSAREQFDIETMLGRAIAEMDGPSTGRTTDRLWAETIGP